MKLKGKIFVTYTVLAVIYVVISVLSSEAVNKEVYLETSIDLNINITRLMIFSLFLIGSFIDTVIIALLINIFTVIFGVHVKALKGFFIGSVLNLIINIYMLLKVVLNNGNQLSMSTLTTNLFLNPLFYIGILSVGFYVFNTEKRSYKTTGLVVGIIVIYKLIVALLGTTLVN